MADKGKRRRGYITETERRTMRKEAFRAYWEREVKLGREGMRFYTYDGAVMRLEELTKEVEALRLDLKKATAALKTASLDLKKVTERLALTKRTGDPPWSYYGGIAHKGIDYRFYARTGGLNPDGLKPRARVSIDDPFNERHREAVGVIRGTDESGRVVYVGFMIGFHHDPRPAYGTTRFDIDTPVQFKSQEGFPPFGGIILFRDRGQSGGRLWPKGKRALGPVSVSALEEAPYKFAWPRIGERPIRGK